MKVYEIESQMLLSVSGTEEEPGVSFGDGCPDDETTGIGEIVIEGDAGISGSANADGRIYNLQGQQVTAPVKGLYIKNNKKVIIK